MFTRIGVDGRDGGRDALTLGARLARVCDAGVTAVHVAHEARDGSPVDARAYEALLARELAKAHVRADTLVIGDHLPGSGLRLAASRTNADLVVLGSSHRGRRGPVLAGDTARAVLHGAHWRSPSLAAVSAPSPGTDGRSGWASTVPPRRGGP
jgi:nucleotide-binding universal stress UspA family protein